jgi:hypothetical protein
MSPESRHALLSPSPRLAGGSGISGSAVSRPSLAEIADREGLGERYVRLLAPLAFVATIADGHRVADLTITTRAKALPYSWAQQERCFAAARPSARDLKVMGPSPTPQSIRRVSKAGRQIRLRVSCSTN